MDENEETKQDNPGLTNCRSFQFVGCPYVDGKGGMEKETIDVHEGYVNFTHRTTDWKIG